jgi:hypothetical protein
METFKTTLKEKIVISLIVAYFIISAIFYVVMILGMFVILLKL